MTTDQQPGFEEQTERELGMCCMGAAARDECTCWEPLLSAVQHPIDVDAEPIVRDRCCGDCAYRNGSPEREQGKGGWLRDLAEEGERFWCHGGLVEVIEYRHPDGTVRAASGDYRPHVENGIPYKADGTPGEVCAGWAAHAKAVTA